MAQLSTSDEVRKVALLYPNGDAAAAAKQRCILNDIGFLHGQFALHQIDATAGLAHRVECYYALIDCKIFGVPNCATLCGRVAARERQTADGNLNRRRKQTTVDIKNTGPLSVIHVRRRIVPAGVDREQVRTRAVDRERIGDRQARPA